MVAGSWPAFVTVFECTHTSSPRWEVMALNLVRCWSFFLSLSLLSDELQCGDAALLIFLKREALQLDTNRAYYWQYWTKLTPPKYSLIIELCLYRLRFFSGLHIDAVRVVLAGLCCQVGKASNPRRGCQPNLAKLELTLTWPTTWSYCYLTKLRKKLP